MKDPGSFLEKCAAEQRISNSELARRLNVTPPSVSRMFKCKNLTITRYLQICEALKIDPRIIFEPGDLPSGTTIGNITQTNLSGNNEINFYRNEIENLNQRVKDKEELIREKDRLIQILLSNKGVVG